MSYYSYEKERFKPPKYNIIYSNSLSTKELLLAQIKEVNKLALDLETDGEEKNDSLNPLKGFIVGISLLLKISKPKDTYFGYYIPLNHRRPQSQEQSDLFTKALFGDLDHQMKQESAFELLNKAFSSNPDLKIINHNIKFDYNFLKINGLDIKNEFIDTIIQAFYYEKIYGEIGLVFKKIALKEIIQEYLDLPAIVKFKDLGGRLSEQPITEIAEYAINDCFYSYYLDEVYSKIKTNSREKEIIENIEYPLIKILSKMELAGIRIDLPYFNQLEKELSLKIGVLENKIKSLVGKEINLNSPRQIQKLLYDDYKLPPIKKLAKSKKSPIMAEKLSGGIKALNHLQKIATDDKVKEVLQLLQSWLSLTKIYAVYIKGYKNNIINGRLYYEYCSYGTKPARISSRPNIQNIPLTDNPDIRKLFLADDNQIFVVADWTGMHLYLSAALSKDSLMFNSLLNNEDLHYKTAQAIFNLDKPTKEQRRLAKYCIFAILYGGTEYALSGILNCDEQTTKELVSKFQNMYSGFYSWKAKQEKLILAQGYSEDYFGHKRYIETWHSAEGKPYYSQKELRGCFNHIILGTEAKILKISIIKLDKIIEKENLPARIVSHTHDEIAVSCHPQVKDRVAEIMKQVMQIEFEGLTLPVEIQFRKNLSKSQEALYN